MSAWISHVKAYQAHNGVSYREAMKASRPSYHAQKASSAQPIGEHCPIYKTKCEADIKERDNRIDFLKKKYNKHKKKGAPELPPQYDMADPPQYVTPKSVQRKKGLHEGKVWLGGVPHGTPKEILTEYDDRKLAEKM